MILILIPVIIVVLFFVWTLLPIMLPRNRLGTWITTAQLILSLAVIPMVWLADPSLVPGAAFLAGLGGLFAALRLLLQRGLAASPR
ncbi:hypothetical protein AB0I66_40345 [Streptomyces sp. NPDC050439]|uniref:hypothetical protein n=1 Tax=unclassified Streptomyces TaxID=2593676 RepID=UPI00341CD6AF